jgi:Brp/Blh family beta-carotene 15,15'-monooxygenase
VTFGPAELALLAAAVFLIGTPHGALDARVARDWLRPSLGDRWAVPFVAGYLALAGATLALWLAAPAVALGLFLLLAAVHFGQHDSLSGRWLPVLVRGTLPPVIAAAAHPAAIISIFTLLGGSGGASLAAFAGGPLLLLWIAGAAVTLLTEGRRSELVALAALFLFAPPLIAFSLYFALVHTPRAMSASRRPGERWPELLRAALPWSLAAVALAVLLWTFLLPQLGTGPALVRTVFWWLSALTVPHLALHLLGDAQSVAGSHNTDKARAPAKIASLEPPATGAKTVLPGPIKSTAPTARPALSKR